MIGSLSGKPVILDQNTLLIDIGGVGYKVLVPPRIVQDVGTTTAIIHLWIYTYVRKDTLDLYGFPKREELELFKVLLGISGIGPRTALTLLDRDVSSIKEAVVTADVAFFTTVPRLGKKNAQRIIIELKPKLGSLEDLDLGAEEQGETRQVLEALKLLGFSRREAQKAIGSISKEAKTVEEKVKLALKHLGK